MTLETTITFKANIELTELEEGAQFVEFVNHVETEDAQAQILDMVTAAHVKAFGPLAKGTALEIGCVHEQDDTFVATPDPLDGDDQRWNDVECELFVEYYTV